MSRGTDSISTNKRKDNLAFLIKTYVTILSCMPTNLTTRLTLWKKKKKTYNRIEVFDNISKGNSMSYI